jgi:hypothetical protein
MCNLRYYRRKAPALFLLEAGGRKYNFCPLPKGFKAPKFIYEKKKNMYFETRSARNTASLLNPLNLFMEIPSASCLLTFL